MLSPWPATQQRAPLDVFATPRAPLCRAAVQIVTKKLVRPKTPIINQCFGYSYVSWSGHRLTLNLAPVVWPARPSDNSFLSLSLPTPPIPFPGRGLNSVTYCCRHLTKKKVFFLIDSLFFYKLPHKLHGFCCLLFGGTVAAFNCWCWLCTTRVRTISVFRYCLSGILSYGPAACFVRCVTWRSLSARLSVCRLSGCE